MNRLCAGKPDLFDPPHPDPAQERRAQQICSECPALIACREFALTVKVSGVAGGMTEEQRDRISSRRLRGYVEVEAPVIEPGDYSPEVIRLVTDLAMNRGLKAPEIGERLGMHPRRVLRMLAHARQAVA